MIYRKSLLLVCCCKLCCVYCGPKKVSFIGFSKKCNDKTCTDVKCKPSVEVQLQSQTISKSIALPAISSGMESASSPSPIQTYTPDGDTSPCADPCCSINDGSGSHVDCGIGCDDFLHSIIDKTDKSVAWILDFLKKKCCSHKHRHNHNHHHNHYPSFVWTPGEIPEILRQTNKKHRTLNQPATQSITSQR